ncbi:unnamed protein product [Discula destructiva]
MKTLILNLLLVSSAAAAAAAAAAVISKQSHYTRATNSTPTSYLARMADTWVGRGVVKDFNYKTHLLYKGFEFAIELIPNATYVDWLEDQMSIVLDNGLITTAAAPYNYSFYSLDEYRVGMSLLYWYNRTGQEKYRLAADTILGMLHSHPRNNAGGFWHRAPVYPYQMWGDGIFMADSFYARYTKMFDADNMTAWDDIMLQYDLLEERCRNPTTNLLVHGYDESKKAAWADPITGASPLVWDRADGWYFMSLTETLQVFPQTHEGYQRLVAYFQSLAEGVLRAQDASGGWWLIMDEQYKGAKGNYIESSASLMFVYGFFVGVRLGFLDAATYLPAAKFGYEMLVNDFLVEVSDGLSWDGTVQTGSLSSNASYEYYTGVPIVRDNFMGVGPFMWASYEYEIL